MAYGAAHLSSVFVELQKGDWIAWSVFQCHMLFWLLEETMELECTSVLVFFGQTLFGLLGPYRPSASE